MAILKFLILSIAIICSLWIACWIIASISQLIISIKFNQPFKCSINFLWFVLAGLAWAAFYLFF